jgi:hypothetical protein
MLAGGRMLGGRDMIVGHNVRGKDSMMLPSPSSRGDYIGSAEPSRRSLEGVQLNVIHCKVN